MKPTNLLFRFSIIISQNNPSMNRVFPIIDEENDSSAETINRKIEMLINQSYIRQEFTGPKTCKICLQEETGLVTDTRLEGQEKQQEMIIPCECRGSVGYVHQKCIKMWIKKQLQGNKSKRAYCEICKSEVFFKKIELKYCECKMSNLCDTSLCDIACVIGEIFLIAVVALVQNYIDRLINYQLLRNTLLALLGILCITFFITVFLILKQSFLKTYKEVQKIYSITESEQLGFRQPINRQQIGIKLNQTSKRRILSCRKERKIFVPKRPSVPFESISPQLVVTFN